MPLLMEAFGVSAAKAGLLMSLFAVTGLLWPSPRIHLSEAGYRLTGMIAILSLVIGRAGGPQPGFDAMLASRFIEGAGMSLMSVVAPAVIACGFPRRAGKGHGNLGRLGPPGINDHVPPGSSLAGRWDWQGSGGLDACTQFWRVAYIGLPQFENGETSKIGRKGFFRKQAESGSGEGALQPRFVAD